MFLEYDNIENNANGLSVLAVMASPRKSGYTAKLLGSLLREFPKGTNIEIVNLYDLNPVPCNACGYCKAGNGCSKKDLEDFFKKFETTDIIIFATPIYFMGVPAPFKALIDRFQRYYEARFRRNMKNPIEKHRKAALIVIKHQLLQAFTVLNIELCGATLARNTDKCGVDKTDVDKARALYWKVR